MKEWMKERAKGKDEWKDYTWKEARMNKRK